MRGSNITRRRDPSPVTNFASLIRAAPRANFARLGSHKGRGEEDRVFARDAHPTPALTVSANRCQISGRQLPWAAPDVDGRIQIRVSAIRSVCAP